MGNGFAKTGSWDEALDSYQTAVDQMQRMGAETRYMALFNMGIAYEYTNQFDEARRALKEAYALEQDDMILQEIQHVSYREREYAQLVQQGAAVIPPR
jgi:tetratricopeptide (TPR) repeat protein